MRLFGSGLLLRGCMGLVGAVVGGECGGGRRSCGGGVGGGGGKRGLRKR